MPIIIDKDGSVGCTQTHGSSAVSSDALTGSVSNIADTVPSGSRVLYFFSHFNATKTKIEKNKIVIKFIFT